MAKEEKRKTDTKREEKKQPGRPPKYTKREELKAAGEKYFADCEGIYATDEAGTIMQDKHGNPIFEKPEKPQTMTGLARALGMTRASLANYAKNDEFADVVVSFRQRIEEYAETRLYDRDGCQGAKFTLSNNFGWSEKTEQTHNISLTYSDEEAAKKLTEYKDLLK